MNDNERDVSAHFSEVEIGDIVTHVDWSRWEIVGRAAKWWQLRQIEPPTNRLAMVHQLNEEFYCLGHSTMLEILSE